MTEPESGEITEQGSGRRDAILNALMRAGEPIAGALDVWGRAVKGAFGYGPGVADDEILPAGVTLSGMAMTGSLAGARPPGSLGAGGRIWAKDDLDRVKDLRASGLRDKQIAHELGRSVSGVSNAARYHDLGGSQWKASNRSDLLREAWEAGKTIPEIAASTNMHPRTVQRIARDLGLPARPQGRRPKSDTTQNGMLLGGLGMAGSDDAPYGRSRSGYVYGPDGAQGAFTNTWLNRRMLENQPDIPSETWQEMSGRFPHMLTGPGYENEFRTSTDGRGRPLKKPKSGRYGGGGDDIPDLDYGGAGSPYDEDTFMPMPVDPMQSRMNTWLNQRLDRRMDATPGSGEMHRMMSERIPHMMTPPGYNPLNPAANDGGTDMDMMRLYGPEDQVAFDAQGRPIRLDDPRHPRNQSRVNPMLESYPQQRRR